MSDCLVSPINVCHALTLSQLLRESWHLGIKAKERNLRYFSRQIKQHYRSKEPVKLLKQIILKVDKHQYFGLQNQLSKSDCFYLFLTKDQKHLTHEFCAVYCSELKVILSNILFNNIKYDLERICVCY